MQILGTFATNGNIKGKILNKILIEAIILAENAGLLVDFITCDGASWNRAMWREFGIGAHVNEIRSKILHPINSERFLYFFSDFPHLIKCVRNIYLKHGFNTPDGEVRKEFVQGAFIEDNKNVRLKAMPKITKVHLQPNNFKKMKVNLAFQLFSIEVLKELYVYDEQITSQFGNPKPPVLFIQKISKLIEIMTSRMYRQGLKYDSMDYNFLKNFLVYLEEWEIFTKDTKFGYLSQSTSLGLKITISNTLLLVEYLTKKVNFSYLFTSRLSQDKLENLFSIVRQCKGSNDHPTPGEFIIIIESLSFYNIAQTPIAANYIPSVVKSLVTNKIEKPDASLFQKLDFAIENNGLDQIVNEICSNNDSTNNHQQMIEQRSDIRITFYIAGYVVRKFLKKTKCSSCKELLQDSVITVSDVRIYTEHFDLGGLTYPSSNFFNFHS